MRWEFVIACLFASGVAGASELPQLKNTKLFTETAKGCKDMNMESWRHPTRQVFIERGIKLQKASLCNDNKFPIFYAEIPYDPHLAHNDNYLFPLYRALLKANGEWPFAIVATSDNAIIVITGKSNAIKEEIEDYAE